MDARPHERGHDERERNKGTATMERGNQPHGHDKGKVIETENRMGKPRQKTFPSIRRYSASNRVVCAGWTGEHRAECKRGHSRTLLSNLIETTQDPHRSHTFRNSTGLP
jgi:hypothetical protein